ncbi:tocopherol cyclase family protein [Microbacterium sp.]|uniref:tocopherol cyclase family protein n=1 Tax=Microbacterium sp. TaxID=51671 RepID=UPI003C767E04
MGLRAWYRSTGADLPFQSPLPAHPGVAMEGYFWRITDPATGRVMIALNGVNLGPKGPWATLGFAAHPSGFLRVDAHRTASADPTRVGAHAGDAFHGDDRRLCVDLGPDARLDVTISDPLPWSHRAFGGSSIFQAVPALNQYWHPWLLGGRVNGTARLGDETWQLRDAQIYAEKNWGREGFPDSWWWGQAQGFEERDACVAFAGGQIHAGPLRTEVTGLVVRLPGGRVIRLGNPGVSPVHAVAEDERWMLRGRGFGWTIDIDGTAPRGASHILPVPLPSQERNTAGALEHLAGVLEVTVRRRGRVVWAGRSALAGLEHGGLERARAELVRRGLDPAATHAPPVTG